MSLFADHHDPEPQLVPSVTEDDEDIGYAPVSSGITEDRELQAAAYIWRYQTMVQKQRDEDTATLAHLEPCIARIQALAGKAVSDGPADLLQRGVAFGDLAAAFRRLEESTRGAAPELMTSDRQLMMVLHTLTHGLAPEDAAVELSWAEFIQAYRLCIAGMDTLQHLPESLDAASEARERARNRILSMLSLFEAGATKSFDGASSSMAQSPTNDGDMASTRHSDTGTSTGGYDKKGTGPHLKSFITVVFVFMVAVTASVGFVVARSHRRHRSNVLVRELRSQESHFHQQPSTPSQDSDAMFHHENGQFHRASQFTKAHSLSDRKARSSRASKVSSVAAFDAYSTAAFKSNGPIIFAVLGSIVGAAGAPFAALVFHKLVNVLIASQAAHMMMFGFAAAAPTVVGGFFIRMAHYARNYELEFSIE